MAIELSDRQRNELHKSMLDYLHMVGYTKAYAGLREEAPGMTDFTPDSSSPSSGLLVKKWMSIIRMQRKIMDLEARLAQAKEDISHFSAGGSKPSDKDWLPVEPEKLTLVGHRDKINAICFHPSYSVLASASVDATVRIWDWEAGESERTLKGHTKAVRDCKYDSTGKVLATCSDDLLIKLWSVADDYKNFATLRGHEHTISSVYFLPGDDRLVSSSRDHTVRVWEVQTSHCVKVLRPHDGWIRSAMPSPDGTLLLTCADDHLARISSIQTEATKVEMRGHDNRIEYAAFVPAPSIPSIRELIAQQSTATSSKVDALAISFVMTASRDKTIKLWDGLSGQCLWTFVGHDGWVQAIAFHPGGKYFLSVADDHTMRIWDLKTGRCLRKIEAHRPFTQCVAWATPPQATTAESVAGPGKDMKGSGNASNNRIINVIATGGADKLIKIWRP